MNTSDWFLKSLLLQVRKGGWRYLDTRQVLIEGACSVDRVDEALSTLLPMLLEIQYFQFNPSTMMTLEFHTS